MSNVCTADRKIDTGQAPTFVHIDDGTECDHGMTTTFGVAPNESDWYYCAVIEDSFGETDYMDGYASGDKPKRSEWIGSLECKFHSWVAGMCYVSDEDLETVAATRKITCETCDAVYGVKWRPSFKVLEWEVKRTASSTR